MATDVTLTVLEALGVRHLAPAGALVGSTITAVPDAATANACCAATVYLELCMA